MGCREPPGHVTPCNAVLSRISSRVPQVWLAAVLCLAGVALLELGGGGTTLAIGWGDVWSVLQAVGFGTSFYLTERMMAKEPSQVKPPKPPRSRYELRGITWRHVASRGVTWRHVASRVEPPRGLPALYDGETALYDGETALYDGADGGVSLAHAHEEAVAS